MSIGKPARRTVANGVRGLTLTFLASLCALAGGLSLWSAPALACPNEELRAGPAASLPDCRAYEMVSPPGKNGSYVNSGDHGLFAWGQASAAGDSVAYTANGAFPGSVTNGAVNFYLASRGEDGWTTQSLLPPQAFSYGQSLVDPVFVAYSSELSEGILLDATDSPPLVSGEQETTTPGTANLFLRDDATGTYALINAPAPGLHPTPYQPIFDGATADFATLIFNAKAALTPDAPAPTGGVDNLYESTGGAVSLVSEIPPAGEPSCGPAGPACVPATHGGAFGKANDESLFSEGSLVRAISADGSHIFFTAEGNLYVRENGATTVQVDAPQGGPGPGGGGEWATAAADGSEVFFYDAASAGLTADTVPGSGENLYDYDTLTDTLTDLTTGPAAEVQGVVDEASEDGSYLYFVARGDLTGEEENSLHHKAEAGAENIYLSHDGTTSFVDTAVTGSEEIASRSLPLVYHSASRVTPDGRHLAFFAENDPAFTERVHRELFEYSADSGRLSHLCACAGSSFPQAEASGEGGQQLSDLQYTRALSDDGSRVFFESYDPLLPQDTNGQLNVYEYELDGAGSCQADPGCLYSISSGTSAARSDFVDASASGDDVFVTTAQQLVPADTDGATDLYDARVEGGFPSPPSPAPCLGDACQAAPTIVNDPTPASFTFSGAGNLPPSVAVPAKIVTSKKSTKCSRGGRLSHGKCVKPKSKQKAKAKSARDSRRVGR